VIDLISGVTHLIYRSPGRVGQLPIDVARPGDERALIAATHRHDDVRPIGQLLGERLRYTSGEIDPDLVHHTDDGGVDRPGGGRPS
jgi:hypothetical protein